MQFWTTFCPSKTTWELSAIATQKSGATSNWREHVPDIERSLKLRAEASFSGIRLVIFPHEVSENGIDYHWNGVDMMLDLCQRYHLAVDLCLGPLQYPYYPGIFLPPKIIQRVSQLSSAEIYEYLEPYAKVFLREQLEKYALDNRIRGFYLGNEWPSPNAISGLETEKVTIPLSLMIESLQTLKEYTNKPILLNTNIHAVETEKIMKVYTEIFSLLKDQGKMGLDVYPSQETFGHVPHIKLLRLIRSYHSAVKKLQKEFAPSELFFAEVEAQPWGSGQSWESIISACPNPQQEILGYTPSFLPSVMKEYIYSVNPKEVSLWGADFWLSCAVKGILWPLKQIEETAHHSP